MFLIPSMELVLGKYLTDCELLGIVFVNNIVIHCPMVLLITGSAAEIGYAEISKRVYALIMKRKKP